MQQIEPVVTDLQHNFQAQSFSGPLDLLLFLSKTEEIDITEIKIHQLVDQYVIYISTLEQSGINVASNYLIMMAELIRMKSKVLIQEKVELEDDDEMTPEDLRRRLIEYKKYKDASYVLSSLRDNRFGLFPKKKSKLSVYRDDNTRSLLQ